jgi:glycosyltransferase involved in cell wall biosynthesis
MNVTIYCPDRHIEYSGTTPETVGVGGGVTARIHLARALARRGHEVTAIVNCRREEVVDGARFLPLDSVDRLDGDVVVVNTSGDKLSLEPAHTLSISSGRLVLWVHGVSAVAGLEGLSFDSVVVPSDFIAGVVQEEWGYSRSPVRVIPNGFVRYALDEVVERDPHRIAYTSHPQKGLATAIEVLEGLRERDARFHLHLYGGAALWGQEADRFVHEAVVDHGLVPQPTIAAELRRASFALHMQAIPEAFSISVSEAMAAGAIVVASPVGALRERIDDGRTGILVSGDHRDPRVVRDAVRRMLRLASHQRRAATIRKRAAALVVDWDEVAGLWERWFAHR